MSNHIPTAFAATLVAPTPPSSPAPETAPTTAPGPGEPRRVRRSLWPLFGVAAGVTGLATTMLGLSSGIEEEDRLLGAEIIPTLERGNYHVAFVVGLVSLASLIVTAAAWRRWADQRAPRDLAARVIGHGLAVTAAANVLGVAMLGSLALYLPGGMDEGTMSDDALFVNFALLDFGTLFGWWGALVGSLAAAVVALRPRHRLLPRWMGVAAIVLALPALAFAFGTALPGFSGLTTPVWLTIVSVGLMFSRTAEA